MRSPILILVLVLCLPAIALQAADTTSTEDANTSQTETIPLTHYFYKDKQGTFIPIDTGLQGIDIVDPLDEGFPAANTGNFGAPHFPLVYRPNHTPGFDLGYHQYDRYRITSDSLKRFLPFRPYSRIDFGVGTKSEQIVDLDYGQQYFQNFFLSLEFTRMRADGPFQRQNILNNNLGAGIRYTTLNQRYKVFFDFIFNQHQTQENGGMATDDVFGQGAASSELIPVRIQNAENNYKDQGWHLHHSYDWGINYGNKTDTAGDTHFQPTWRLTHEASFEDFQFKYSDFGPQSSQEYYREVGVTNPSDTIRQDTISLAPSMQHFSNRFTLKFLGVQSADTNAVDYASHQFRLSLAHNFYQIDRKPQDRTFQTVQLSGAFQSHQQQQSPFHYKVSGAANFGGYTSGDFTVSAEGGYDWGKAGAFDLLGRFSTNRPSLLAESFEFRDLSWNRNFDQTRISSGGLRYELPQLGLTFSAWYHRIENHLYWSQDFLPVQSDELIDAVVLHLTKNFDWGKFHFDNDLYFQTFSDPGLFRMSKFYTRNRFYFQSLFFNKAMLGRMGLDFSFRTETQGKYYLPVTGQLYLSEDDLTYYPTIDVFVSFKVETARFYFKFDYLNQGFPGQGFFNLSDYPNRGRTFRGGVSWRFLD